VRRARVSVGGETVGEIAAGLCVLVGVAREDDVAAAERLAAKLARLRVFENEEGRFDRSLLETGGAALVVSQFTLITDTARGNRPSFTDAARPEHAEPVFARFCAALEREGPTVVRGVFGSRMLVEIENDGPVTIILDV
jgi:D-aminoacyl-tRNA deacylase